MNITDEGVCSSEWLTKSVLQCGMAHISECSSHKGMDGQKMMMIALMCEKAEVMTCAIGNNQGG